MMTTNTLEYIKLYKLPSQYPRTIRCTVTVECVTDSGVIETAEGYTLHPDGEVYHRDDEYTLHRSILSGVGGRLI